MYAKLVARFDFPPGVITEGGEYDVDASVAAATVTPDSFVDDVTVPIMSYEEVVN